jgi:hypothetical protein
MRAPCWCSTPAVTRVDVVEKVTPVAATAEAMLAERKLASVVSDALSAEELRRSVASDAAAAAQKITGVSVVGAGYVYVRGLGERYSATTLNRALIPTTEPEKRVVPLDLFPAALIDNIRVLKTYSPDMPGEFSAGLVELRTVDFPSKPIFNVSFSSGFNTRTTFNPFLTYPGGRRDFFGFDDGARALPSQIPRDKRLFPGAFTPQQFQDFRPGLCRSVGAGHSELHAPPAEIFHGGAAPLSAVSEWSAPSPFPISPSIRQRFSGISARKAAGP